MSSKLLFILVLACLNINAENIDPYVLKQGKQFGGWAICKGVLDHIKTILPASKTILELGSGDGTKELLKFYKVYSVEHNTKWLNKYHNNYIYAPIKNNWYSSDVLKSRLLKVKYNLIIVDGPPGHIGRYGFYKNLEIFNTEVPIIFDDVNRKAEFKLMEDVSKKLNKPFKIYSCNDFRGANKLFGVIK